MSPRILVAFLVFTVSARAAEIHVSVPIQLVASTSPNQALPISVPGFNPALGTLVGVKCHIGMHELMDVQGENQSPVPAALEWKTVVGIRMSALDSTVLFDQRFPERTIGQRCAPFDGLTDFAGPSGFTVTLKSVLDVLSVYATAQPAALARFVGPGPRPFLVTHTGGNLFTASTGNTTATLSHKVWARFVVTYVYTPAP